MMNNLSKELEWIEAWNDLDELIGEEWNLIFLQPDWTEMDLEDCKGWLQDSAYQGYHIGVKQVWYKGKLAIQVYRKELIQ